MRDMILIDPSILEGSISSSVAGRERTLRLSQSENEYEPILVTDSGRYTSFRAEHS